MTVCVRKKTDEGPDAGEVWTDSSSSSPEDKQDLNDESTVSLKEPELTERPHRPDLVQVSLR